MPRKTDHRKAREELRKLAPEFLQAVTFRLPAGLLVKLHEWAEEKGQDLATAIRELVALGLETATNPTPTPVDRTTVKKWEEFVWKALWAGESPLKPFLQEENPNLEVLPVILAKQDYGPIYHWLKKQSGPKEAYLNRIWGEAKGDAPSHVRPLMDALDNLEKKFLARGKLYSTAGAEEEGRLVLWLLSDKTMQLLEGSSDDDPDIEAVRRLIAARYLVPMGPNRPWEFMWDA